MDNKEEEDECSICLEPLGKRLVANKENGWIPCGHRFHVACLSNWFETAKVKSCPYCMRSHTQLMDDVRPVADAYFIKYLCHRGNHGIPRDILAWVTQEIIQNDKVLPSPCPDNLRWGGEMKWRYYHFWMFCQTRSIQEMTTLIEERIESLCSRGYAKTIICTCCNGMYYTYQT